MKETEFKHFEKVLVRDDEDEAWIPQFFSYYDKTSEHPYACMGDRFKVCIPYEGNESLCDTTTPYVSTYEPKDGDFIVMENTEQRLRWICIFKYRDVMQRSLLFHFGLTSSDTKLPNEYQKSYQCIEGRDILRPAMENEKEIILAAMHQSGKDWDSENKKVVDYYKPKEGDFVTYIYPNGNKYVAIFKGDSSSNSYFVNLCLNHQYPVSEGRLSYSQIFSCGYSERRMATEEEKQQLFDALHEAGKDWDAENKKVVNWKWEPERDEIYYCPKFDSYKDGFSASEVAWEGLYDEFDKWYYERGWAFRTNAECQKFCDKLNEAIQNVK